MRDPSAAITWARELMGVSKKLLTPSVVDAVVKKVNQKRITNSKDLRKLRTILPDPVAKAHFLSDEGDLESAMLGLRRAREEGQRRPVWRTRIGRRGHEARAVDDAAELKGDPDILKKIDDAEAMLRSLRKALS